MIWPFLHSAARLHSGLRGVPQSWTRLDISAADPVWLDSPPQFGTHLIYELQLRNAQAVTAANINVEVNADFTTADYHFQRYLSLDGAAAATEATQQNGGQVPGASATANVFGTWFILFPWFRTTTRQKVWIGCFTFEEAATSQDMCFYVQKRVVAGTGTLNDPITSVRISHGSGTATDGTLRRAVTA